MLPGIDAGGRLWVRDGGNARYTVFDVRDTAAVAIESIRMAHNDANFQAPILFDASGRFIDIGHRPSEAGLDLVHFHRSAGGAIADSVRIPATPADSMGMRAVTVGNGETYFLYPPHGPLELVGQGPGGQYARALSSVYRIDWHDASGTLMRTIGLPDVIGPELTAEERERAEQNVAEEADRFGLSASERSAVPARRQPLNRLFFDPMGRLWVQRSTSAGQPRRADVWEPAGTHAFSVQWPADVDLFAVYDTFALGVRRDSLDVGSVVRLVMEG